LVWFPAGGSIDSALGLGNQVVYVTVSGAASMGDRWGRDTSSAFFQPGVDLVGVEAQQSPELEMGDRALRGPGIQGRLFDPEAFCHLCDRQQDHKS
jgi:hypothetical protein